MSQWSKRLFFFLGLALLLWIALGFVGSWISIQPRLVELESAEHYFGSKYQIEENTLEAEDGQKVVTWFAPNDSASTVVVLLAGIGGNRAGMVDRAKLYLNLGFGVLIPDLRGTGESSGGNITFGWEERLDLLAAVDFLQKKGTEHIAVHGVSLGAATISYTLPEQPPYEFIVMESPYDNIIQALENRVHLFNLPLFLFRPLIWWTEWRLNVSTEQLAPEIYVHLYQGPIFLMAGDSELKVKKAETQKIFHNMTSANKQLFFFQGAKHLDYLKYDPDTYQSVLTNWLNRSKDQPTSSTKKMLSPVQ